MRKFFVCVLAVYLVFSISLAAEGTSRTIKVNKVVSDYTSEKWETDKFNFYISEPGSLKIEFEFDVQGAYNVRLMNLDEEKEIQYNTFSSEVNTSNGRYEKSSNKLRVSKGDYQIQVSQPYNSNCDEEYELKVVYEEEDSNKYEKENNNDARNAMPIDYNRSVTGNLESNNDVDYYMVELPSNGEICVELRFDIDAVYNVEIFSEENGSLKSLQSEAYEAKLNQNSATYARTSEKIRVPRGNYYFKISKPWNKFSNEDYIFTVDYSKNVYGNYEIENNNDAKSATGISLNTEFIGNLNNRYDVDFYKVSLWNSNRLTIKMNVPDKASYQVITYKEINGELKEIKSENFSNKDIPGIVIGDVQEVFAGDYYFKVVSSSYSNKDYVFIVSDSNNYYVDGRTTIILEINNPNMMVNNNSVPIDGNRGTVPTILNSRTMLPARAIIEALGGNVTWIEGVNGININLDGKNVYLTLNSALAYVNGEQRWLDVAPTSINGRTMVPVKFVMDNLGGSVIWNATTGTVTITY